VLCSTPKSVWQDEFNTCLKVALEQAVVLEKTAAQPKATQHQQSFRTSTAENV